jgi:DNA-directed RNA polymerase specialized sigma24 family protein
MTYSFTVEDRQKARTPDAKDKARQTVEERQRYQREDVLLLRRRGMVPLAIADELGISLRRVVAYLREAGVEIPGYLTTSGEPPREPCRHCGG